MAEQSRRFVSLDKPIDKFIEDQKNKNTLSKTERDVSLLTEFLNSQNESSRIELRKSRQKSLTNRFGKHVHIAVKCFIVIMKVHKRIKRVFKSSDKDRPTQ